MDFSGRGLLVCFPYSVLLGSTVGTRLTSVYGAFGRISHFLVSGRRLRLQVVSVYSALSWVRQRTHALRQSTELVVCSHLGDDFMFISVFSVELASSADTCSAVDILQFALKKEEVEERRRQEEVAEHERRMRVLDRRIAADEQLTPEESYAWRAWAGHLPGGKRKGKKRRKKKTPRASSHSSLRRAHRRQRQWYVLAGFAGYDTPLAVFPSIVDVRGDSTGAVLGHSDMPVVVPSGAFGQTVQKTADSPQWQFIAGRLHSLRAANADSHGPCLFR